MRARAVASVVVGALAGGCPTPDATTGGSAAGGPAAPGVAATTPADVVDPPAVAPTDAPPAAKVDDGPIAQLRTGASPPEAIAALEGTIVARSADDDELYEIELSGLPSEGLAVRAAITDEPGTQVLVQHLPERVKLFVRRPIPRKLETTATSGTVWFSVDRGRERVRLAAPFTAKGSPAMDRALPRRFVDAWAADLRDEGRSGHRTLFHHFAAGRVHRAMLGLPAAPKEILAAARVRGTTGDLSQLMYTTTAATSLHEALQYEKALGIGVDDGRRDIDIASIPGPALVEHAFDRMRSGLTVTGAPATEPMAANVPADFWYLRFDDIRDLLRVLDEAGTWLTPVVHAMEERPLVRDLSGRYQRELGLARTGLAKALGHTVVSRVAIVGSDPYLRDGSDVSFVFQVAAQPLFDGELAKHLTTWQAQVPGITRSEVVHQGHTIAIHGDAAQLVRQHRAQVGDLCVVSNSLAATKRILDAIDGRAPRLADEPDLKYMLARDPGEHDAFGFIGDRFVAEVVGPRQKIQQSRRMRAAADLAIPGHAAALYGWIHGVAPTSAAQMRASGVLTDDDLRHGDGAAIAFEPGAPARSVYGRADALVPRIDLEPVTKVTATEQAAYEQFSREYQDYWRQFIDPIAIRIDLDGDRVAVDVRVLPLIEGTDYRDVEQVVGKQRIEVPAIDDGVHAVWAVGRDTELRRDIDRLASGFSGKGDLGIGWLGEWVMVGALDRASLTDAAAYLETSIQKPPPPGPELAGDDAKIAAIVGKLPVFAVADVNSQIGLVATLAALQTLVSQSLPGAIDWSVTQPHGEIEIVRVGVAKSASDDMRRFADSLAVYYAQAGGAIAFALNREALVAVLDRLANDATRPKDVAEGGTQFVIEGHARPGGGAQTALSWAMQEQALLGQEAARAYAETILRADPSTAGDAAKFAALATAYLGGVPVTPEGRSDYTLAPEGVTDPVHGSALSPIFPALPVPGSTPLGELMARLASLRASVSFDDEPTKGGEPSRSLHTRFELVLGGEAP